MLGLILFAFPLLSQMPRPGEPPIFVLADGVVQFAELAPDVVLTHTPGSFYRIQARQAKLKPIRLTRRADGTYVQVVAGMVIRNGIVQTEGEDYTVAGATLTPVLSWSASDLVLLWTIGTT